MGEAEEKGVEDKDEAVVDGSIKAGASVSWVQGKKKGHHSGGDVEKERGLDSIVAGVPGRQDGTEWGGMGRDRKG